MAEPARRYDFDPPRPAQDPFNPVPPERTDPLGPEPLTTDLDRPDVVVDNRGVSRGNGLLIAAVVIVLAAIAFYIFGPGASETVAPPSEAPATTTEPAPDAAAPAPDATAPAAPEATAPAAPEGAAPAPESAAPAEPAAPAPAEPAPAPAQ